MPLDPSPQATPRQAARPKRPGPRPLPLHLATATLTWLSSAAALPFLKNVSAGLPQNEPMAAGAWTWLVNLPWHPTVRAPAAALNRELAAVDPDAFARAVDREVRRRLDEFEKGLTRYRRHPYRRELPEVKAVWREGTTRLRDYAGVEGTPENGVPLLLVPSLINRSYILDLTQERSLIRFLGRQGFRPFLVDWGRPGAVERRFDLNRYILQRLGGALDKIIDITGRKPGVIGYCMGGNLALGLAHARQGDIAALALLATPWDFHAERADLARAMANITTPWVPVIEQLGELPVDMLQSMFFGLDPFLGVRKFRAFAGANDENAKAQEFVALEDWLNDGVPLAWPVARECILDWYGANTPARGEWRLGGRVVRPEKIAVKSLVVVPAQDRIVPPASAAVLAKLLPNAEVLSPPLGHIGMVVSVQAPDALWRPLAGWLDSAMGRT